MVNVDVLRSLAIRPGQTSRFLERAESGEPFFPFVDTAWEIFHRLTREEVIEYLDTRQAQGFNGVMGVLIPELDVKEYGSRQYQGEIGADGRVVPPAPEETIAGREAEFGGSAVFYPNRYGQVPLINDNPANPNEDYFAHIDWVVDQAAQRGILVWLVPTWSRFVNTGWADGPILFNEENVRTYGQFLGKRYPFLPKLIGGDSNPDWINGLEVRQKSVKDVLKIGERHPGPLPSAYDLKRQDTTQILNALARSICETESPYWNDLGRPFLTYHPTPVSFPWAPPATASAFFGDQDWLVLDGLQSGHADFESMHFDPPITRWNARASHEPLTSMWRAEPTRPIIDLESHYEEAHVGLVISSGYMWDVHDIRSGAWQSILSGACGIVYGCNVIWQMYDSEVFKAAPWCFPVCGTTKSMSWKKSIHLPGPSHLKHMVDYFASLPRSILDHRLPAQDCLISSTAPPDRRDTDARIDVMRDLQPGAESSSWMIAHSGMGYEFELDLSKAFAKGSTVRAQWLNPRDGSLTELGNITVGSVQHFTPPSKAEDKPTDDWVLVLTSR